MPIFALTATTVVFLSNIVQKLCGQDLRTPLSKLIYVSDYQNVFIKNSQSENAKMTILTDLSSKLSFETSKPKRVLPYEA